jgi:hypothetical protein
MRKQPVVPVQTTSDVPYLILLLTALAATQAEPSGPPPQGCVRTKYGKSVTHY